MQRLWLCGIDWDTPLPTDLQQKWSNIYGNINAISDARIPRWLQYSNEAQVQLHGFADASELAYAAVTYLKVIHSNGTITTRLIAAKTRVAPVKQITLPRLELCACHLLAKLLVKVKNALKIDQIQVHGWSDSTIVLAWLSDHPSKWKNFIANRTSYIINILPAQHWHHISSKNNPADLATRGLTPTELQNARLWWEGPTILQNDNYQQLVIRNAELPNKERKKNAIFSISKVSQPDLLSYYSDFTKLLRITARVLRFVKNCKTIKDSRYFGILTTTEINHAHSILIKLSQHISYSKELQIISSKNELSSSNKLSTLSPFLDKDGLLRVGGRLENANITYNQKHPLIIDKDNVLTELIVRYYHLKFLHAGPRQMTYLIGLKYWIPSGIYAIKRCVYKCPRCMRFRCLPFKQQMGNLPKHRLYSTAAFCNVGVDFAGPFMVRSWKGRGSKKYKCSVAVFVCLVTKAMHLELVTQLTTEAFLATLRRFVSRRGRPDHIYSDNGTNFIGCNKKLKDLHQFLVKSNTQEVLSTETTELGIQWHFSPPLGPNFGGIWESGVRSIKYHLYRVLGNSAVTYEEMNTILCQVECCLNSRPISAKFEGDPDPLTPAHFLVMRSMQTVPDQDLTNMNINRLTRWQYLQQLVQTFWKKWSMDYLNQLQGRQKWKAKLTNLKLNDIVILKDDLAPPCNWLMGKVVKTHPGQDGLVRVVTVQTKKGEYKRPITKLCPLLVD